MYKEYLLSTRPYSWITTVLIGLTAHYFVFGRLTLEPVLYLTVFVSLLGWISGQTLPDYFRKRIEYKENASLWGQLLPTALLLTAVAAYQPTALIAAGLLILSILLYIAKVKIAYVAKISYLVRGFAEVSLILLIFMLYGALPTEPSQILFIGAIYMITGSRNLIGDIRDLSVDEYTLPTVNKKFALGISLVMGLAGVAMIGSIALVLPVLIALLLVLFYGLDNAYMVHRLYVISTMFFVFQYLLYQSSVKPVVFSNILFIGVLLNFTYDQVPRKLSKMSSESGE